MKEKRKNIGYLMPRFGSFFPQGWGREFAGCEKQQKEFDAIRSMALECEKLRYDSIWLYYDFIINPEAYTRLLKTKLWIFTRSGDMCKMRRSTVMTFALFSIMAIAMLNIDARMPRIGVNLVKAMPNVVPRYCSSELSIEAPYFSGDASQTNQFNVAESSSHGFVHVSSMDPHYLEFDDGTPFHAVGINTGWWLDESEAQNMKAHNISLGRVWMCSWHINIEPQLGVYSESAAAQLDNILAVAEKYDLYIQLVLLTFTDFSEIYPNHWVLNPYNTANDGPCEAPADFFTNDTAKDYIKNRFNYILNRWSDNPRIAIWEFWNEVDLVGRSVSPYVPVTDAMVNAWQEDVAQVFRQNDTHHRPLTISCSGDIFWNQTFLSDANDIIQIHTYNQNSPVSLASQVSNYIKSYENSSKPVVIGEYGVTSGDKVEFLHSGLWPALASGSGYSSMYWYTNHAEISEDMWNRYLYFERFVHDIPWPSLNISEGTAGMSGASNVRVFSIQGDEFAIAWVQHTASEGTVSGAKVTFYDLSSRAYTVYIYNDSDGTYLDQYYAPLLGEDLTVDLPNFIRHLAVKVTALEFAGPVAEVDSVQRVELGKTVTFDASGSLPGWNGTHFMSIISYDWNFGDGETGTGMIMNHTYIKPGAYNVTLTVQDEVGDSDTASATLNVETGPVMLPWLIAGIVTTVIAASIALYFSKFRKRRGVKT